MHGSEYGRRHRRRIRRMRRQRQREHLWLGVLLMIVGVVFLLHQFYVIEFVMPHSWFMAIPIAFGVIRVLSARSAESVGSGVSLALICLWVWACLERWHGLTWTNSWPIALAATGLSMVIKSLPWPGHWEDEPEPDDDDGGETVDGAKEGRNHA